ncbi:hypothetical protein HDU90_004335 [Geranomyces variabilis]|nr:hypothetical protein HDU90_004335 [Geranomyces variabilis]
MPPPQHLHDAPPSPNRYTFNSATTSSGSSESDTSSICECESPVMNLDELPVLTVAHLKYVQVVPDKVWFSRRDGYPYVRIKLKTQGRLCRANFHDLSPVKQQAVIDDLLEHIQEDGLSEDEVKRLSSLIMYMGRNKRTLFKNAEQHDRLDLQLECPTECGQKKRRVSFADPVESAAKVRRYSSDLRNHAPHREPSENPSSKEDMVASQATMASQDQVSSPLEDSISVPRTLRLQLCQRDPQTTQGQSSYKPVRASPRISTPPIHTDIVNDLACSQLRGENWHLRQEVASLHERLWVLRQETHAYKQARKARQGCSVDRQKPSAGSDGVSKPGSDYTTKLEALLSKHAPAVHEGLASAMRTALYELSRELVGELEEDA